MKTVIKRNPADAAFSEYIRARANYTCERCGMKFVKGSAQYLHCSHNYHRGHQNIRYHPLNALALCKNCHFWFERERQESTPWLKEKLGSEKYAQLLHALEHHPKPKDSDLKQIAAYYRVLAGLHHPTTPDLPPKPIQEELDRTEKQLKKQKEKNKRINDLDVMERMLQSYTKIPNKKQKKAYRQQIIAIMAQYPINATRRIS